MDASSTTKEIEERKNIEITLKIADDIYKVMQDDRMRKLSPDDRHKIILEKHKEFANMYPVVARFLARDIRYNRLAFEKSILKMLKDQKANASNGDKIDKQKKSDPLRAMKAFITHQADYAKFLYIEECKRTGKHYNLNTANAIWKVEYEAMSKALKKIKDDEDRARNEFEEEKKKHLGERRKELLNFILEEKRAEEGDLEGPEGSEGPEGPKESKINEANEDFDNVPTQENDSVSPENEDETELKELQSYVGDLNDAYNSFNNASVLRECSNIELEEYTYVLEYCKHLFELAVEYEKITLDDKNEYDNKITFCLETIKGEFTRRREEALEKEKEDSKEWLEGLIPMKKPKNNKQSTQAKKSSLKKKH